MTVNFVVDRKGKKADNLKRIQIHVVEAQGLSLKGSTKSPPAYVTIESPGLGTLHQTGTISKGRSLVWHENSRIVELKPSAQIRFIVKRQARWPITHNNVLGSTDTYNLCKLIEMQGKNDRETCVTLSLKPLITGIQPSSSLVVNIRDLDTSEKMQQVREYALAAARRKSQLWIHDAAGSDVESLVASPTSPTTPASLDMPITPMTASSFSSSSSSISCASSMSISTTAEAVVGGSMISTATTIATPSSPASPASPTSSTCQAVNNGTHTRRGSKDSVKYRTSLNAVTEETMQELR